MSCSLWTPLKHNPSILNRPSGAVSKQLEAFRGYALMAASTHPPSFRHTIYLYPLLVEIPVFLESSELATDDYTLPSNRSLIPYPW